MRQEREEEDEGVELPPETLPGYSRIMERQRSFRVLKERRAREAENAVKVSFQSEAELRRGERRRVEIC